MKSIIKWNKRRKFGVELEFTSESPNNREFLKNNIASCLRELGYNHNVEVRDWEHTNNNNGIWVCKTDSSCGYEVCTPPLKGSQELKLLGEVCKKLEEAGAKYNQTCGLHVHLSLADFTNEQFYTMLMYWIKNEHNVMNAHPRHRQQNIRYCSPAVTRIQDWESDVQYQGRQLYREIKNHRGAINVRYWECRKTVEWRMGEMSLDAESVKNRIRFLIWFVDVCKHLPPPENLNLFHPSQMMRLLGLLEDESGYIQKIFSPAVESMRQWILNRMEEYTCESFYEKDKLLVKQLKENITKNKIYDEETVFSDTEI